MEIETAPHSGDPETDSLAERRWITAGAPITFSFPTAAAQFTGYTDGEPFSNFEALNGVQQAAVRTILTSISSFTNLTFTELTGSEGSNAVLRFGMSDAAETAHAYLPSASEAGGDSWYNNSSGKYNNPVLGNYAWDTIFHELGHALGLVHPHESTPPMPGDRDWMAYTVMSYRSTPNATDELGYFNETWSFPQSYMIEDIAALQFLYGANYTSNAGDTVYRWNGSTGEMFVNGLGQGQPGGNRVFTTVWDGGGIDTYDFSTMLNTSARIDLRPGVWSFVSSDQQAQLGGGNRPPGNVANAALFNGDPRSLIENAIGTQFDDIIYGNHVANVLTGGAGADTIHGLEGDDTLHGNAGINWLHGEAGNDTLRGGENVDILLGGIGDDAMFGGAEADQIYGEEGDDWLEGQEGDDGLLGGDGADALIGGLGDDVLSGDAGNDVLIAGEGDNDLYGDEGNDTLTGGTGNDRMEGGDGADVMTGGLGNDTYSIDQLDDQIFEYVGEGTDTVETILSYVAPLAIENIRLMDISTIGYTGPPRYIGPISATGNALDNVLQGNSEANALDGGAGADKMSGGGGDDTYYVDNVNDKVTEFEGGGIDSVYSSVSYVLETTPPLPPGYDPYAGASMRPPDKYATEVLILTGSANINGTGSEIDNTLTGNTGNNILDGMAGNDTLTGGPGADILIGGTGQDLFVDTATGLNGDTIGDLSVGDRIRFTDAAPSSFAYSVSGSTLVFTGGSLALPNLPVVHQLAASAAPSGGIELTLVAVGPRDVRNDFNGDGRSDILWRHDSGHVINWLGQASGGFAGNDANVSIGVPNDWRVTGTGDFNGDGRDDILWRHQSGYVTNWLGEASGGFVGNDANASFGVPNDWNVASIADFDGDGRDDILWRHDSGYVTNWLGQANGGFVGNDAHAWFGVPNDWHVAGTGDFNGDGRDDILWRHDGGQVTDWLGQANGGFVGNDANAWFGVPDNWHVAGTGDFNGDGRDDILWRDDNGHMTDWLGQANGGFVGNDVNAWFDVANDWHIANTGDFNGDGRDDILWRHDNGHMTNWLGQANGGFVGNEANASFGVANDWHVQTLDNLVVV